MICGADQCKPKLCHRSSSRSQSHNHTALHRSVKNYLETSSDSESAQEEESEGEDHGRRVRRKRFAICAALLLSSDSHGRGPQVPHLCVYLFVSFRRDQPICFCRGRNIKNNLRFLGRITVPACLRLSSKKDIVSLRLRSMSFLRQLDHIYMLETWPKHGVAEVSLNLFLISLLYALSRHVYTL